MKTIRDALADALGRRGIDGRALDPWYFPNVSEYAHLLTEGGFHVEAITSFPRPTELPTGIQGWVRTFGESFLSPLPPASRPGFIAEVSELLSPRLATPSGTFIADYVRLRVSAKKPVAVGPA